MAVFHCLNILIAVCIQLINGGDQGRCGQIFLHQDHGEALLFERSGIQDLISAACGSGQGNQKIRLVQSQKLTDGIRPGP